MREWLVVLLLALASATTLQAAEAPTGCANLTIDAAYRARVDDIGRALGIPPDYASHHRMQLFPEGHDLRTEGRDVYGRPLRLQADAMAALRRMIAAASRDHITLQAVSGFRSVHHQRALLAAKLARGMTLAEALRINAAPGYSEHHTGCAIDLTSPGIPAADDSFERSPAYRWLLKHAADYGFRLSFPTGNPHGIEFEPWHWRYRSPAAPATPGSTAGVR